MLFDNLGVEQIAGPVLEGTLLSPPVPNGTFGRPFVLTMSGISTVALLKLENNYKYTGKELNHKEFSDGAGTGFYFYQKPQLYQCT